MEINHLDPRSRSQIMYLAAWYRFLGKGTTSLNQQPRGAQGASCWGALEDSAPVVIGGGGEDGVYVGPEMAGWLGGWRLHVQVGARWSRGFGRVWAVLEVTGVGVAGWFWFW